MLDPDDVNLLTQIGFLAAARGDAKRAEVIFGALLRVRAERAFAHVGLAMTWLNAGRAGDAVAHLRNVRLADKEDNDLVQAFLGLALQLDARASEAQRVLTSVAQTAENTHATEGACWHNVCSDRVRRLRAAHPTTGPSAFALGQRPTHTSEERSMDIINTAAMAALSTATSTSAVGASAATAAPDAMAAAAAELMAQPSHPCRPPNALEATAAAAALQPTTNALPANPSVGDRILQGMENVSQTFRNSWEGVNKLLDTTHADTGNVQDMLKLQMQLTQVAFEYDLVGKLVSRSTQNIDQLVRVQ